MKRRFFRALSRLRHDPNHWKRKTIGFGLVIGGILGPFLPVLGIWMLPIGIVVLSVDLPWAQQLRIRYKIWRHSRQRRARKNEI